MDAENFAATYESLYRALQRKRLAPSDRVRALMVMLTAEASALAPTADDLDGMRGVIVSELGEMFDRARARFHAH